MNIGNKMTQAFSDQIDAELYSAHLYLQMSFWFAKEGWEGFSKWMLKQSDEEKEHAVRMARFVIDRGGEPHIGAIVSPEGKFADPKQVFELTLKHEQEVTEMINRLADVAEEEHDRASINFIDTFIDEQVEEEKTVRDILNMFRHRDGHTVAVIDDVLGQRQ